MMHSFTPAKFSPESVVEGRAEDPAVVAEADLLDEPLPRVRLLQEVGQPRHVPVDPEPARGVNLAILHNFKVLGAHLLI